MKWDRWDSLAVAGAVVIAAGLALAWFPSSLLWVGGCALFVGVKGSAWAS